MNQDKTEKVVEVTTLVRGKYEQLEAYRADIELEIVSALDEVDMAVGLTAAERKAIKSSAKALAKDKIEFWEDDLKAMLEIRAAQTSGAIQLKLFGEVVPA